MQECTPEIIQKAAKRAGLEIQQLSPTNPAYLISNSTTEKSFVASSWSLFPNVQNWQASIMRYKELCSHYLSHAGFNTISGQYAYTPDMTPEELLEFLTNTSSKIGFPCVIKPNTGSLSRDIYIIKDSNQLTASISQIHENITDLLVQEYIDQDEYRVFIHKGEIVYLYKKQFVMNNPDTDRLSDSPLGKEYMMKDSFSQYLQVFAEELYRYTNAEIIGADIFIEHDIEQEQHITIIELNHNPGLGVMYQTYNEKELIIEFLSSIYRTYLS